MSSHGTAQQGSGALGRGQPDPPAFFGNIGYSRSSPTETNVCFTPQVTSNLDILAKNKRKEGEVGYEAHVGAERVFR